MKLSLQWLREFTDISMDNATLFERIGERLGAIQEVIEWGAYYDENIIVAEIIEADNHPNADKLGKYVVNTGSDTAQVIAGDKTLKVGDKVAYIPPGCKVPLSIADGKPFTIEARDMRGEMSNGMLGSGAELLLNENHDQVQVLDTDVAVGTSLIEAYNLSDTIIDIENKMFTHRPDCFGILGAAREIAGIQGIQFSSPDWYAQAAVDVSADAISLPLQVKNEISDLCPRFTAVALQNVHVKDAPLHMQSMLMRVGLRPINNVVDITNFVMHLTAQPSHAFDYDKIKAIDGSDDVTIVVRKPKQDETITVLDGREIKPHTDAMLVCSATKPLSIGGSIGGAETEVDTNSKNIILEVAAWDMYAIRRTSFEHGIFTDAVARFNKGQSSDQCAVVASFGVALLSEHTGAQIASDLVDDYTKKREAPVINVAAQFINERLGHAFTTDEIAEILRTTELAVEMSGDDIAIKPPFWRQDLRIAEDIVEEVGRLYGFNNLPLALPPRMSQPAKPETAIQQQQQIRKILAQAGANEVYTYNFVSDKEFERSGLEVKSAYHIRNALAPELQYMRTQLLPSLLEKVYGNIRKGFKQFALFEIGKAHNNVDMNDEGLPLEHRQLSFVYTTTQNAAKGAAFYNAGAYIDYLLHTQGINNVTRDSLTSLPKTVYLSESVDLFNTDRAAVISVANKPIGIVGELSAQIRTNYKLPVKTAACIVDLELLKDCQNDKTTYRALSKFPATDQDATYVTPNDVTYSQVLHVINEYELEAGLDMAISAEQVYQADAADKTRNITLRFRFVHHERTLKTSEINAVLDAISTELSSKLKIVRN